MKLTKLTVDSNCNLVAVTARCEDITGGNHQVFVRSLTGDELRKIAETYNAVAEAAEGSNNLPYQMTFLLLQDEESTEPDFAEPVA